MSFVENIKKAGYYLSLIVMTYLLTFVVTEPDRDLWARLAVGSLFFQTGGVFKHDIFAYTPVKDLWIDHEWLSGTIFYSLAKHFGEWGIIGFKFIIILAILVIISKIIKLHSQKIDIILFSLFAFSLSSTIINMVRSQMFTFLFFVLWIYILEKIRQDEKNNRLLWIIPATMALWANMHGGFVAGIGLLLMYTLGEFFNKKSYLKYILTLISVIPMTLINPYGLKYWDFIFHAVTLKRIFVEEWHPFSLSGPMDKIYGIPVHIDIGFIIFVALTAIAYLYIFITNRKIDWTKFIVLLITLYLSIKHQRHTIFFCFTSFALFYNEITVIFQLLTDKLLKENIIKYINIGKNILGYGFIAYLVFTLAPTLKREILISPFSYPVGSVQFIKQNNIKGNVSVSYGWGGYAFWELYPNNLISVDGRYEEVFDENIFDEATIFSDFGGEIWQRNNKMPEKYQSYDWRNFLKKYHTDIIIAPRYAFSPKDLTSLKGWRIIYIDPVSAVMLPENQAKKDFTIPNYLNPIYSKVDLSKSVNLN